MAKPIAIRAQGICFHYDDEVVLESVDAEIGVGSLCALLGPNGIGKTTLLKLVCGILPLQGGVVELLGRLLSEYSVRQRSQILAYVPQHMELVFAYTVTECVMMGRYPYGSMLGFETSRDLRIVQDVLERVDLYDLRNRYLDELSGGERQRVWIARALAQEPEILVLDEPTSSLDIRYQIEIYDLLSRIQADGKTVLLATHDFNLAGQYCTEMILMKDGSVHTQGPVEEVLRADVISDVFETEVLRIEAGGRMVLVPVRKRGEG